MELGQTVQDHGPTTDVTRDSHFSSGSHTGSPFTIQNLAQVHPPSGSAEHSKRPLQVPTYSLQPVPSTSGGRPQQHY